MRITLLINDFPPLGGGGYAYRLADLRGKLGERGHEFEVVTTAAAGRTPPPGEQGVRRVLTAVGAVHGLRGVLRLVRASRRDGRALRRSLREHRPDVLLVGNASGLSSALWNVLRQSGVTLVLDVSNEWLYDLAETRGNWFRIWEKRSRSPLRGFAKGLVRLILDLGPVAVSTRFPGIGAARVYATSEHMAEELGERCGDALPPVEVCRSGIELADWPFRPSDRPVRRLIYAGRLKPTKGVETAVEALALLPEEVTLTICGVPDDAEYEANLRGRAAEFPGRMDFRTGVPRGDLPGLFAEHDALVFPSIWAEPFSRLVLEAMASGLPLVATDRGGTAEVLRDGENGLLFEAGDPESLAAAVRRLGEPGLRDRIVRRAREDVEADYGLDAAADRLERILVAAAEGAG